jgi:hypothetical protein
VPGGWRPRLHEWARQLFTGFARHPWLAEATVGARPIGPHELDWTERAVAALTGTGLRAAEIFDVAATLASHARTMAQHASAATAGGAEQSLTSAMLPLVRGREDRFPALAAALDAATRDGGQDDALEFGLARILDGVELLVAGRTRAES